MSRRGAAAFLPGFDFSERHAIGIDAPPDVVHAAIHSLDLGGSRVVRFLFRLRGMPAASLRLGGLDRLGFRVLSDVPGEEVVLGLIGRFWTPTGGLCRFDAADFAAFDGPGWAKAVWSFEIEPRGSTRSHLVTETRVLCTDARSRRSFRLYWLLIRPFSGLIRRVALREIRRSAVDGRR